MWCALMVLIIPWRGEGGGWSGFVCPHMTCGGSSAFCLTLVKFVSWPICRWRQCLMFMLMASGGAGVATLVLAAEVYMYGVA